MPYKAFLYALRDWWDQVLVWGLANVVWLFLALLVVPLPPATAGMFLLARGTALREYLTMPDLLAGMGRLFLRSWGLALISGLGIVIGVVDILFYTSVVSGLLGGAGAAFLFYLLVVWCQAQCYAWAQLAWRPDLSLFTMQRNGLILAARYPVFSLALALVLAALLILSVVIPPLLGLAFMALWAAICVQALARLVPELLPAEDRARLQVLAEADAADESPEGARRRARR